MSDPFDLSKLREPSESERPRARPPRHRPWEKFLKGPVPWRWIEAAARLPGQALAVGLVAWYEAGCRKCAAVPLNLSRLVVPRRTAHRGLCALERAGLVSVDRRKGRPPVVTLLPAPAGPSAGAPERTRTRNG
ncbi:hypothetical protein R5W23_005101 [Gemmata sp. JC673]|uniref:MarR family transcriptional regulator n=1 Tax=Gemmata algarum TaxID=2975278 RepID=A0ABU5F9U0_9BACT|nr:hypothetical protein [Gemmata algarum]MDY3563490.1 hypothetical protein [Gemmata algarum]